MKTKEDILSSVPNYSRIDFGLRGDKTPEYISLESAENAMDEYAKQQAIAFAKWISDNEMEGKSEDLYAQFIEHQNTKTKM